MITTVRAHRTQVKMQLYAVILSMLDVVLPGNAIVGDHFTDPKLSGDEIGRTQLKRSAHDCGQTSCVGDAVNIHETTGFWIVALGLATIVVLSGVSCVAWEMCRRKLPRAETDELSPEVKASTGTRSPSAILPVKRKSVDSVSGDSDEHPDRVLYSSPSGSDEDKGSLDLSIEPSDFVSPVVCSPYHLAWTTPTADKHRDNGNQQCDACSFKTINECETESQNPEPECDQESTSPQIVFEDEPSMTVCTPNTTPGLGYIHGRPRPTPLERLASGRSSSRTVKARGVTPAKPEFPMSPKGLFLDKSTKSRQSPMQRLLDLQPRMSKMSDDSPGLRLEDSLQWDSFPFRSREDSLVWDDFMMETSDVDDNNNDTHLAALAELV